MLQKKQLVVEELFKTDGPCKIIFDDGFTLPKGSLIGGIVAVSKGDNVIVLDAIGQVTVNNLSLFVQQKGNDDKSKRASFPVLRYVGIKNLAGKWLHRHPEKPVPVTP